MEVSIRRKLAVLAALLVAVAACSAGTDRQLQELYDSGTRELLQGELDRARERADQGLRLSSNRQQGSPWTWKFRLLHDEIRLIDRQLSDPFPALDEAVPQADDYAWVRARQRYLKGQHHLVRGDLPAAIAAFDETARLATAASGERCPGRRGHPQRSRAAARWSVERRVMRRWRAQPRLRRPREIGFAKPARR